jgi:hypothetical protein
MKSAAVKVLMIFAVLSALCAAQTLSAADKLPLKQGLYVREGVPCESAPNADIINFWGDGLGSAHVFGTITHMRKNGNVYNITQKMEGLGGVGGEGTYIEKSTIIIKSRMSFAFPNDKDEEKRTKKKETLYRWCSD